MTSGQTIVLVAGTIYNIATGDFAMHINDINAAADYRMVQGRDWIWDFLGRDCREVMFESYGPPRHDESYPVSAVFHCGSGDLRMLTVEHGPELPAHRWIAPSCVDAYLEACELGGYVPWAEIGITWVGDIHEIVSMIRPALHPDRRPSDDDLSYLYEAGDVQMMTEMVDGPPGDVRVNG